tara:strand:- start:1460 stop:1675 length:216 start_codon:yes stop_codon:yes gene_type:complete
MREVVRSRRRRKVRTLSPLVVFQVFQVFPAKAWSSTTPSRALPRVKGGREAGKKREKRGKKKKKEGKKDLT